MQPPSPQAILSPRTSYTAHPPPNDTPAPLSPYALQAATNTVLS